MVWLVKPAARADWKRVFAGSAQPFQPEAFLCTAGGDAHCDDMATGCASAVPRLFARDTRSAGLMPLAISFIFPVSSAARIVCHGILRRVSTGGAPNGIAGIVAPRAFRLKRCIRRLRECRAGGQHEDQVPKNHLPMVTHLAEHNTQLTVPG